ncbi:hypothetical protein RND81_04G088900 [Saponaria officinalis]|uniref:TTF-type domain-containing protein n=1 Tax=Saponaria officinalis TaxID=3572 RepID=A0AAW1LHP3_SAPOF
MKKSKYKTISDFFSGAKSQKTGPSCSPHQIEPLEDVSNEIPHVQEEQYTLSQDEPQNPNFGKRIPIASYPPNDQDTIRRRYISMGPYQPRKHSYPPTNFGTESKACNRQFRETWYDNYIWLEYSIEKDAAFCFVCYLFKDKTSNGSDRFVGEGFRGWNRAHERFVKHIGQTVQSVHRQAQEKYDFFINPRSSIVENFNKTSMETSALYKARLTHSLDCLKFLLRQGLAFRGHDESETSSNKDIGDDCFGILADESSDVSYKEQLAICLRYVDKKGRIRESFLGVVKVDDTCSLSLKIAIKKMVEDNKLSMSKVRGQGYDGASNMRGEINGLKTLIMNDTPSAYYIHCFAHQLQLTLIAVAKDNYDCKWFFEQVGYLLNLMGVSCKHKEMLRVVQAKNIVKGLELGEIKSGQGLNQELGLARPGDTRWGSYYKTILNIISLYPSIFEVLIMVGKTGHRDDRLKAQTIMLSFESFQFVFMAQLLIVIFGYTNELCQALQRRDQDIVNVISFVRLTKERLQKIRDEGWEEFFSDGSTFCFKHDIEVPNMDDNYIPPGRSRRYFEKVTNLHRFRVDMFISIIDLQLYELNNRFDEVNMELLICMSCFSPINSFAAFDKLKLRRLVEFYPADFSSTDLRRLEFQLDHFIDDMRKDVRFEALQDLGQLSTMLVSTNKHSSYQLVYLLLRLVLILLVATASVERVFSSMTYVKNKLRNSMCDESLNDSLVTFIERDFFSKVVNDDIINRFQNLRTRRSLLSPRPLV